MSEGILLVRRDENEGALEVTTLRGEAQIFPVEVRKTFCASRLSQLAGSG